MRSHTQNDDAQEISIRSVSVAETQLLGTVAIIGDEVPYSTARQGACSPRCERLFFAQINQHIQQLSVNHTQQLLPIPKMTITDRVQGAFYNSDSDSDDARLIRLAPNAPPSKGPTRRQGRRWTNEEHDRFLQAMEMYPSGPWKDIADHVGTRSTRQTMTHAQKYRQKIARWKRGITIKPAATNPIALSTPPSSPQAPEELAACALDTTEDIVFWQVLEDILEETDGKMFEESMGALLDEYTPMDFSTEDGSAHDVDLIFENFASLL